MKSPRKTHNLFGNHIFLKLFCFEMSSKKVQAVRPVSLSLVRMCLFRVYFFPKLFFTAHITSLTQKFENVNTTKCQQLQKNVVTKQNVSFRGLFLTNFYFIIPNNIMHEGGNFIIRNNDINYLFHRLCTQL